jgi:hypothetical protein
MRYTGAGLEYVGVFGWVDTPLPAGLAVAWLMAVAAVLGLAVATEPVRRPAEWLVGLAVLAAGMSAIVLHTMTSGFGWQPRYVLPVLASALVVAAGSLASVAPATGAVRTGPRRVLLAAASVAVTVHAVSPLWTFARYRWGFSQLSPHFPAVPVPRPAAEGVDLLWEPVLGPSGMLALGLGSLLVGTVVVALVALVVPAGAAAPVPSLAPPADSGRPSGVSDRAPAPPGGSGRSRSSRWPRPADAARRR